MPGTSAVGAHIKLRNIDVDETNVGVLKGGISGRAAEFEKGERASLLYCAVQPPSIRMVSPVMREAAGEARNTTAPATSMGSPMRCSPAMRAITSWRNAAS